LVVDDSALVRRTLTQLLTERGGMQVTVAADPYIASMKMLHGRPDVIVLDLELPRMDGLTFLARIMAADPIPVVICSAFSTSSGATAVLALERGAVDVITKPKLGVRDFLEESAITVIDAIRSAAASHPVRSLGPRRVDPGPSPTRQPRAAGTGKLIVLGASTGGTEALLRVLSRFPSDAPPTLVVQHMPQGFTTAFARRLDELCAIHVREAADGDRLQRGVALVAPGDRHLSLRRVGAHYEAQVAEGPLVARHRPSVDVLFASVARVAAADAVGVIMTGMGADGADGLLAMRRSGAATLAQDKASCVVFGMPKEAIARGAVAETLPLDELAEAILRRAS
jgi:two-component system chemotaxis response regulator CheB